MILADVSVRRPVFATMGIAALVVMGIFSYRALVVDLFPRADIPVVSITTTLPGAGPEEMEARVTKLLEETVNTVSGIDEVRSVTLEGFTRVIVLFRIERELEAAAQDVRDKVGAILGQLPDGTDPPVVEKFDPDNTPILYLAVAGDRDLRELTEIAKKQVKERLESLPGVGAIKIVGGREREVQVVVDPRRLEAYDLTIRDVARALAAQNVEVPGGRMVQQGHEAMLRTLGRVGRVEDFEQLVVAVRHGTPVRVMDLGRAIDGVVEPRSLSRYNGHNGLTLLVRKQSGANTVATVDEVIANLAEIRRSLPPGVTVTVTRDQAHFIRVALQEVQKHLIVGALLASVVVFLFVGNWRATLIAAVAIPCSVVATFSLMKAMGFTLNWMTMLALTLSVGIVIDDAIVVLENIFRFIEEKNLSPFEAARAATAEVGLAVSATTLSLVVIFVPVAFIPGIMGQFLKSFGLTMAGAIMVSLLIGFTLTPMLCSRFLHHAGGGTSREAWFFRPLDRGYTAMLRWAMRHRALVVLAALLTIASIPVIGRHVGSAFFPQDEMGDFEVNVKTPQGYSLERTDALARALERDLQALPGLAHMTTNVGSADTDSVTTLQIVCVMVPIHQRTVGQFDVMEQARQILRRYPELRASVDQPPPMSGTGMRNAEVVYNVQGPDLPVLERFATKIAGIMTEVPGIVDVDSTIEPGRPEVQVRINRAKATDLGVDVADIAMSLRTMVAGDKVTTFKDGVDLYDVRLRLDERERSDPDTIARLTVPSSRLGQVRLDAVVDLVHGTGPAQIDRHNRERQITLLANMAHGYALGDALREIKRRVRQLDLPPGYHASVTGMGKLLAETQAGFQLAFILSVIFMYMVLASQFESFLHPITILLSLPLAVPFALFSLWLIGGTVDMFSALGVLLLFGVVKKNAILQIDHTIGLRASGVPMSDAIIQANRERLRPILMTTISLVAGMVPLVFSTSEGAETNRSIGIVVMGGQTLCLLITLLITPVAYSLFEDLKAWRPWRRTATAPVQTPSNEVVARTVLEAE
ncbi:MAG TPA: efflux RND transporter permease subunit [Candidatus Binatia bacterium]|nr:efflux RND transporter permease subunit [Candidatus Binatia bacterium]